MSRARCSFASSGDDLGLHVNTRCSLSLVDTIAIMPSTRKRTRKGKATSSLPSHAIQFLIVLQHVDPLVWRRIQVPNTYTFWDLHVAIQDAMGWLDMHLHEFEIGALGHGAARIGIPDDDFPDVRPTVAGWDVPIDPLFGEEGSAVRYAYDFGDNWQHSVIREGPVMLDPSLTYPRCVSGAGACPPEDVGGAPGYAGFLVAINDPQDVEHASWAQWAEGRYRAAPFDPASVRFWDPRERWKLAFSK